MFSGQNGYGYISFEKFIDACQQVNAGDKRPDEFDRSLPTINATICSTAILEAGRRSLDSNGRPFDILYDDDKLGAEPVKLAPVCF